jgi:hypothetical protein
MTEPIKDWYFTFPQEHKYKNGYVRIVGTYSSARKEMFRRFGSNWAMQYSSAETAGVKRFNLKEIK